MSPTQCSRTSGAARTATAILAAMALILVAGLLTACSLSSPGSSTQGVLPLANPGVASSQGSGVSGGSNSALSARAGTPEMADQLRASAVQPGTSATKGTSTSAAAERLVIRDVTLRLKVGDVSGALRKVGDLADASGGYVESMRVASDKGGSVYAPTPQSVAAGGSGSSSGADVPLAGYVVVRVPAARLARFTKDAVALGTVLYQATDAQDVTAQHVDMKARLANLQATESGLRRLFTKARNVTEMLAVQRQLTQVQGDIESLTAQIKLVEDQATMSSVTVQLVGPTPIATPAGDDWGFLEALRTSLRAFVGTINAIIIIVGATLPLVIIIALIAWAIWMGVRRSHRRRVAAGGAAAPPATPAGDVGGPSATGAMGASPEAAPEASPSDETQAPGSDTAR